MNTSDDAFDSCSTEVLYRSACQNQWFFIVCTLRLYRDENALPQVGHKCGFNRWCTILKCRETLGRTENRLWQTGQENLFTFSTTPLLPPTRPSRQPPRKQSLACARKPRTCEKPAPHASQKKRPFSWHSAWRRRFSAFFMRALHTEHVKAAECSVITCWSFWARPSNTRMHISQRAFRPRRFVLRDFVSHCWAGFSATTSGRVAVCVAAGSATALSFMNDRKHVAQRENCPSSTRRKHACVCIWCTWTVCLQPGQVIWVSMKPPARFQRTSNGLAHTEQKVNAHATVGRTFSVAWESSAVGIGPLSKWTGGAACASVYSSGGGSGGSSGGGSGGGSDGKRELPRAGKSVGNSPSNGGKLSSVPFGMLSRLSIGKSSASNWSVDCMSSESYTNFWLFVLLHVCIVLLFASQSGCECGWWWWLGCTWCRGMSAVLRKGVGNYPCMSTVAGSSFSTFDGLYCVSGVAELGAGIIGSCSPKVGFVPCILRWGRDGGLPFQLYFQKVCRLRSWIVLMFSDGLAGTSGSRQFSLEVINIYIRYTVLA